jgi:HK97 family phage prohead protease
MENNLAVKLVPSRIVKFSAGVAPREIRPRTFRAIASTAAEDREGDVIELSAWELDAYRQNPVILASHDGRSFPVARCPRIAVEGGALVAEIEFPESGVAEASDEAFGLVKGGYLRAVSVGFISKARKARQSGGFTHTKVELVEISLVSVPAHPGALIQASHGRRNSGGVVVSKAEADAAISAAMKRLFGTTSAPTRYHVTKEQADAAIERGIKLAVNRIVARATGRLED